MKSLIKGYGREKRLGYTDVGYEVFTAVAVKSSISWSVTPRSPLSINQCFRENIVPSSPSKNKLYMPPAFKLVS
jgi:hypothetical protein